MKSAKVRIWEPRVKSPERKLKNGKKKPATYQVRWTVAGKECGRTLATKTLAEAFYSKLMVAARNGELFDTEKGLPDSLLEEMGEAESKPRVPTCLELATDYIDTKWKELSAKSRETTIYGMASVVAALVKDDAKAPSEAARRRSLQGWYLEPAKRKPVDLDLDDDELSEGEPKPSAMPAESIGALAWLRKNSLPGPQLADPTNLRSVLSSLAKKMDGSVAANEYYKRRLGVFRNFIYYLVERGLLDGNPLKNLQWTPPKTAKVYDRRRVPNPRQVAELLTAVSYVGTYKRAGGRRYIAFFGCLYYGLQRPEEVIALNIDDCHLPEEKKKWGRLTLHKATPYAGRRWTEDG
jgi:integrase